MLRALFKSQNQNRLGGWVRHCFQLDKPLFSSTPHTPSAPHTSISSRSIIIRPQPSKFVYDEHFKNDPFANELQRLYHGPFGSRHVLLSFRWPMSDQMIKVPQVDREAFFGSRFHLHGMFPEKEPKIIQPTTKSKPSPYKLLFKDFDTVFSLYKKEALFYWSDFRNPNSIEHTRRWIIREWSKHGLPFMIPAALYLYHGLAFARSVDQRLGIPLETPPQTTTLGDVGQHVEASMGSVELFGNSLGKAYPEVQAMYDRSLLTKRDKRAQPALVTEVRPHVQLTLVEGQARWRLVDANKYYSGDAKLSSSKVILP